MGNAVNGLMGQEALERKDVMEEHLGYLTPYIYNMRQSLIGNKHLFTWKDKSFEDLLWRRFVV